MKKPLQRTKVVIRHLPLSLSQNDLLALFHDHFNDHYNWSTFGPENLVTSIKRIHEHVKN
ncbi:hypothetical protein CUMW_202290 [Citrus unshiu]|uniref:UPF3 domain-containing protein n=1 Tax=Citrus unshiu TaxID=55188 RepID=A0A2H5Q7C2_CITUN|nr:hypothetical protein CUMW_202290 [Citrus unshiu]